MTRGVKTSEFWITSIMAIVSAAIGILGIYGAITSEESEMWLTLASTIITPAVLLGLGWSYNNSRTKIKVAATDGS